MGITHVIRGEDHLSNTSKHVELFRAFGAKLPTYAHIPLILKSDGPGKMSKRDRGALIEEYQQRGFLPEAVRNYLCLLGWTPKDGREVLPIADIITQFELGDIHQANARFDERKMTFVNQQTIREMPAAQFAALARPRLAAAGITAGPSELDPVLALVQEKVAGLEHLTEFVAFFFREDFTKDPAALANLTKKGGDPMARISEVLPHLVTATWDDAGIDAAFAAAGTEYTQKPTAYFAPIRYAVSGHGGGPHLQAVLRTLGKEKVLARLRAFTA